MNAVPTSSINAGVVIGFRDVAAMRRRLPRLFIGLMLLGVGIACTLRAKLGVSPYDVLHQGIAIHTGLSFGVVVVGLGLLILLLWIPLRQRPGVGTILNTLTVGFITNAAFDLIPSTHDLRAQWGLLVGGIVLTAFGIGVYIGCGLGPGPRDGLMTGISARGYPLWLVRTLLELTALIAGFALGGDIGIGTLVFAFGIGPLGHYFLARFHFGVDAIDPDPTATFAE